MIDGFINVLKPPGMSSGAVVGAIRRLSGEKVGHAGTLDPEAAGVLPVMIGRAARLFDFLVEKEKTYLAEIAFGSATDTQDAQGTVIETGEGYPTLAQIMEVLQRFTGDILQTPPMYSALKRGGTPLYKLALKGETPQIAPRPITVYAMEALRETPRHGCLVRVRCGRGTYIRTLCKDIGEALSCPAHMRFLLREQTGIFDLQTAVTLEETKVCFESTNVQNILLPMDYPLGHMARADVPPSYQKACHNGAKLPCGAVGETLSDGESIRFYINQQFSGIWQRSGDMLTPRMVLVNQEG